MKKNVFLKMLKKVKLIEKSWQSLEDFVVFSTFGTEKHTMKIEEDILPFAGLEKAYENLHELEYADLVDFGNLEEDYGKFG